MWKNILISIEWWDFHIFLVKTTCDAYVQTMLKGNWRIIFIFTSFFIEIWHINLKEKLSYEPRKKVKFIMKVVG